MLVEQGRGHAMIGRRVRSFLGDLGVVVRWEPLTAAMTDAPVLFEDGKECWFSSTNLHPCDGAGALPDRAEARRRANAFVVTQLDAIIQQHVAEFSTPWPGCEFAKAIIGRSFVAARDAAKKEGA